MKTTKSFFSFTALILCQIYCISQTYYEYKPRDNSNNLDWNKVGQDFNNSLNSNSNSAVNKKAQFDHITANCISAINDKYIYSTNTCISVLFNKFKEASIYEIEKYNSLLKQGMIDPVSFQDINSNCLNQFYFSYQYIREIENKLNSSKSNKESFDKKTSQLESIIYSTNVKFRTEYLYQGKYYRLSNQIHEVKSIDHSLYSTEAYVRELNRILDQH
jgi:hypothetical protein